MQPQETSLLQNQKPISLSPTNNNEQSQIYSQDKSDNFKNKIQLVVITLAIVVVSIVGKQFYNLLLQTNTFTSIITNAPIPYRGNKKEPSKEIIQYEPIKNVKHNNLFNWLRLEQQVITTQKSLMFQVQKNFWLFQTKHIDQLERLYYQNAIYYARTSGFTVKIIGRNNYFNYLPEQYSNEVEDILKKLIKKSQGLKDNDKLIIDRIITQIPLLYVLSLNGGVMLSDYYCLTQDLGWIKHIQRNMHAKRGQNIVVPQIFAFHDPERSSRNKKQNIQVLNEVDKYMRIFPYLKSYFLVAKKQSSFMLSLIHEIHQFFMDENYSTENILFDHYRPSKNKIFQDDYFYLSTMKVLQAKQKQLDGLMKIGQYRKIALHYYGIYTLNQLIGPQKIWAIFGNQNPHSYYQILTKSQEQTANLFYGPLRFITKLTPHQQINRLLMQSISQRGYQITNDSFIQKVLFPSGYHSFIKDNMQKHFVSNVTQPWSALPKIIWVYWGVGMKNAHLTIHICVQNLKRKGKQSGFEVKVVDDISVKDYLDKETFDRVQYTLANAKVKTFPQSRSDFYRMALLMRFGGIYMDITYFALTNFDWIANIGSYKGQLIYNRYGNLPEVIFFFNQQYNSPFNWQYNPNISTKIQPKLAFQNNFIAVAKDSKFMKEWFDRVLSFYLMPYQEVSAFFVNQCKINERWGIPYFVPMDTLQCVIALKDIQIKSGKLKGYNDASDYYKIWAFSGAMGVHKMRQRTAFQSHPKIFNTLLFRYSQQYAEGMIGKLFHMSKFFSIHTFFFVGRLIMKNKSNFTAQIHPQSIFMRHLYYQNLQKQIKKVDGLATLKY